MLSHRRECDDQKNEAITKACEQVNVDFGQIFSTLLAGLVKFHYLLNFVHMKYGRTNTYFFSFIGTNSKLVPIYKNNNTLEGLEIKVIAQYKRYKAKKNKKTKILFPDSCSCFYVRLPSVMCGRRV